MSKYPLGFSVYASIFNEQKEFLEQVSLENRLVFTSLHMSEEIDKQYIENVQHMLVWLRQKGCKVIGDVSKKTLEVFEANNIVECAQKLGLDFIRIDYGFSLEEIIEVAKHYPLVFNASTVDCAMAKIIKQHAGEVYAMHNFYPREYTGLSRRQFDKINKDLKDVGIGVLAFIPNYRQSRGPIFAGLPTLEEQRYDKSFVSYMQLANDPNVEGIFLSDLGVNEQDRKMIKVFEEEQVIMLPVKFEEPYSYLYHQTFTIRIDSPECAYRLEESRMYAAQGEKVKPFNLVDRVRGSITYDNALYERYSGELQILRESLPMDRRVNVIGELDKAYIKLCDFVQNGQKIRFIQG